MNVVGWILVGIVNWNSGAAPVPNYGLHATEDSCNTLKQAFESSARFSSLTCKEVTLRAVK